jgi:hypothetical protein
MSFSEMVFRDAPLCLVHKFELVPEFVRWETRGLLSGSVVSAEC